VTAIFKKINLNGNLTQITTLRARHNNTVNNSNNNYDFLFANIKLSGAIKLRD